MNVSVKIRLIRAIVPDFKPNFKKKNNRQDFQEENIITE